MSEGFRAACVIGWPVAHSRSPLIHNYWLRRHKIVGEYRKEPVSPKDFPAFIATLADRGYIGANVTIPHKETALKLSLPDERSTAVGAANTLWYEHGQLNSTNTDIEGFLANLDTAAPHWDRGLAEAVVLGAGGAARAIVLGLLDRGITQIHLANRTRERADELRRRFGDVVQPVGWEEMHDRLATADLLVNTTSLGMKGQSPLEIDVDRLPLHAVVADIVYSPLITPLLAAAVARGLRAADGLGMLLHQAVRGFELWFGIRPEVTAELRALVEADIAAH